MLWKSNWFIFRAGIIGLYTGYLFVQQGRGQDLVYVAEYLPGDQSIYYTSPWAGGNFSCISADDEKALRHDKLSFIHLDKIQKQYGTEAGLDRSTMGRNLDPLERMGLVRIEVGKSDQRERAGARVTPAAIPASRFTCRSGAGRGGRRAWVGTTGSCLRRAWIS